MNIITQLILICMAIIFVPAIIIVFIQYLVDGEITCYDDDDITSKSDSGDYQHEEFWGVPGGKTSYSGNKATHTDYWGTPHSYSEGKENGEIRHTDFWGTHTGHSVDKGDRIEHYNEWNVYQGYSEKHTDGSLSHHDIWGTEQGRSRKK